MCSPRRSMPSLWVNPSMLPTLSMLIVVLSVLILCIQNSMEQVNTFNDYRKQSNGPYSETYNPRWWNNPNLSWKLNQSTNQGGASHHAHNQYPPRFPMTIPNHGSSTQSTSTSAYQAPTQALTLISQSLEETLKDFMKTTS